MSTRSRDIENAAKARRYRALARTELRQPSEPRTSAQGVTSLAVKTVDLGIARIIREYEMTFNDEECYQLFLAVDDRVRALSNPAAELVELRQRLIHIYRKHEKERLYEDRKTL